MEHASARCQCGHERRLHDPFGCAAWDDVDGRPTKCRCDRFRLAGRREPSAGNGEAVDRPPRDPRAAP